MKNVVILFLNLLIINSAYAATSLAIKSKKLDTCTFKNEFNESIPANVGYYKINNQSHKLVVKSTYFESSIIDCQPYKNKYYLLELSKTHPSESLAQYMVSYSIYDKKGHFLVRKFINQNWSCTLDQGFNKNQDSLSVSMKCKQRDEDDFNLNNSVTIE